MGWSPFSRSVPYVAQMELAECGAACLAMVLGYHGRHAPLAEVREACGVSRDGASAYAIARAAQGYGLEVQALSLDVAHLFDVRLPAILHWEFNHFVVLEKIGRSGAVISDPDLGRRSITSAQLQESFTGVALSFKKGATFQKRARRRPSLRRYRTLLLQALPALTLVFGASLCIDVIGLVFPAANQILVDLVIVPQQTRWLWAIAGVLISATLARSLLMLTRSWVIQNLQFVLDLGLMRGFMDHLMHLPLGYFQSRMPGDLVRRVQENSALRDLFTSRSVATLLDCFLLLAYAALMLAYHAPLGSMIIALAFARVLLLWSMRHKVERSATSELAALGRESGTLIEVLSVPEVTKAFGTEASMVARYSDRLVQRVNMGALRRQLTHGIGYWMLFMDGAAKALILWVGGHEVLADRLTIGVLSAFMLLQMLFANPLESIVNVLNDLQYIGRQLQRLDDVLETEREPTGQRNPGRLCGAIELEHVAFRYGASSPNVIEDVSVSIRPGEKVALVGRTGAGKSTLARLLLGMYWPSQGRIRFDGQDLRELDIAKVRSNIGVVLQEPFFFDDSVRANLTLAAEELPLEALREAARLACIDDVIDALPHGFDSGVGPAGNQLSTGQRQRLALARAIAHRPAVLLLDEATSALDRDTEQRVHQNLASLACTRVVIAHRLATVVDADRIFVLDRGRIVDQGSYGELAGRPGLFQELVRALAI